MKRGVKLLLDQPNKQITIMMLKIKDNPHMTWQSKFIASNSEWHASLANPGVNVQHHSRNKNYDLPHYCLSLFSNKEYFNVMLDFFRDGTFRRAYINVAEPASWNEHGVKSLDLDLDIAVSNKGKTTLLDEDDFQESIDAGHFADHTIVIARKTATDLLANAQIDQFPFLRSDLATTLAQVKNLVR